jgi:hypothetical protein
MYGLSAAKIQSSINFHRLFTAIYRQVSYVGRLGMYSPLKLLYLCFINSQTPEKMKTKINLRTIFLTSIFVLQFCTLFADNDGMPGTPKYESHVSLAPSTPAEAPFEEISESTVQVFDLSALAPETPLEARFEDDKVTDLSPAVPAEADFEELD